MKTSEPLPFTSIIQFFTANPVTPNPSCVFCPFQCSYTLKLLHPPMHVPEVAHDRKQIGKNTLYFVNETSCSSSNPITVLFEFWTPPFTPLCRETSAVREYSLPPPLRISHARLRKTNARPPLCLKPISPQTSPVLSRPRRMSEEEEYKNPVLCSNICAPR